MRPTDPAPGGLASNAAGSPTVERFLRTLGAIVDMPIVLLFAIEGEHTRLISSASTQNDFTVERSFPSRRLRSERTKSALAIGRRGGPAMPEIALFSGVNVPHALISIPLFSADNEQSATIVLADFRTRDDLSPRRLEALEDVRLMIEWAMRAYGVGETPAGGLTAPAELPPRRKISSMRAPRPDPVTGLPDRAYIHAETERRIERASALTQGVALALVSIDRFRRVNDSLGHVIGDHLLRQVAQRLIATADDSDLVGRRGGDEFIVVIDELESGRASLPLIDRIQQALREPFHVDTHELVLSACIGLARYPEDATDVTNLLRSADIALHQAKNEGPGRLKIYDPSMHTVAREQLDLEHQLREAMRNGALSLHYQPKYAIATKELVGAEALLRWKHPQRGMINPGRFIPVAEESGLIVPIGTWALTEACRQQKRWMDANVPVGRLSVNVSGHQFSRHDFVGTVTRAIRAASIPPDAIELELTETVVMHDVESVIARLVELRKLGVRVSVDDFGTGYSSLAYLQKLPVDVLKIDRSFVQDLDRVGPSGDQARSLAQAITYLGHQLGLDVLAEGVETETQLSELANVKCDAVQGFLFGRPMSAEAFEQHVKKQPE